jgi:hypothetical protein
MRTRSMIALTAVTALSAVLAMSACGRSSQPAQPKQPIVVRSQAQDQLHQLDDLNRAIGLKRAIYDSGYSCQRIERSGFVAQYKNLDMWAAHCADGRDWAIFVGPDASAQVRDCKDVARFGLPACVIKPGPSKPAA